MSHILFVPSWYPMRERRELGCFFVEQLQQLQRAGFQVGVIHPEVRPLKSLSWPLLYHNHFQTSYSEDFGIPTYRLHSWNASPLWEWGQMHQWIAACHHLLRRYVKHFGKPALIHAHSLLWGGIAAAAIAGDIPLVITEHSTNFIEGRPLSRPIGRCWSDRPIAHAIAAATVVTAVSTALQQQLMRYLPSSRNTTVEIVPNMVAVEHFSLPHQPAPPHPFRFITIGGLEKRKNISLLLDAWNLAFGKSRDVELLIGGSGPETAALKRQAQQLGVNAHFIGQLPRRQVAAQLKRSHAFVLPSNCETFGVVLVEALACGLPIIATNSGGPADIVTSDVGLLVEKENPQLLATSLSTMQANQSHYTPTALRRHALERYGHATFVKRWQQLYASLF